MNAYDGLDRLVTKAHSELPGIVTPFVAYNYGTLSSEGSKFGRVKSAGTILPAGGFPTTFLYNYDSMGRITNKDVNLSQTLPTVLFQTAYTYNQRGDITETTYPTGRVVKNIYDTGQKAGELRSVERAGTGAYISSLRYHPHGALMGGNYANGVGISSDYNNRLQPTSLRIDPLMMRLEYDYGASAANNGNIVKITDSISSWPPKYYDFQYDSLKSHYASLRNGHPTPQDYSYDYWGNMVKLAGLSEAAVMTTYYPNGRNRRVGMTYDLAGNVTNNLVHTYVFDGENRITSMDQRRMNTM